LCPIIFYPAEGLVCVCIARAERRSPHTVPERSPEGRAVKHSRCSKQKHEAQAVSRHKTTHKNHQPTRVRGFGRRVLFACAAIKP